MRNLSLFMTLVVVLFCNSLNAQEGAWDTTFNHIGTKSFLKISNSIPNEFSAVAEQPDGKIIVASNNFVYNHETNLDGAAIFRLKHDGTMDSSFRGLSWSWDDLYAGMSFARGMNGGVTNILFQPDGKIIVGGLAALKYGVSRLMPNGNIDSTFGGGGVYNQPGLWANYLDPAYPISTYGEIISDLQFSYDSTFMLMLGTAMHSPFTLYSSFGMIAKMKMNGQLDSTWGTYGTVRITGLNFIGDANAGVRPDHFTLQPDGKILVSGTIFNALNNAVWNGQDFFVARLNADGTLDTGFGTGGMQRYHKIISTGNMSGSSLAYFDGAVKLLSNNTIVASAFYDPEIDGPAERGTVILHLTANGQPDLSFSPDGSKYIPITNYVYQPQKTIIQPNGKVLLAGGIITNADGNGSTSMLDVYPAFYKGMCLRFDAQGNLDNTFADNGMFIYDRYPPYDTGRGICMGLSVQIDGKILVAGMSDFVNTLGYPIVGRINAQPAVAPPSNTGIHSVVTKINMSLYPNPVVAETLNINFGATLKDVAFIVTDILGKEILTGTQKGSMNRLSINIPAHVANGIYTISMQSNDGSTGSSKFVLNRR